MRPPGGAQRFSRSGSRRGRQVATQTTPIIRAPIFTWSQSFTGLRSRGLACASVRKCPAPDAQSPVKFNGTQREMGCAVSEDVGRVPLFRAQAGRSWPYVAGRPPAGSIRHLYETRCLPGVVGRNPYVLPSCGARGYALAALVHWTISFEATGAVTASGSLPSRITSTGLAYPVSEARAFLVGGGNG